MVARVCLGQKGSAFGLWVSKAGVDVLSAGAADLLFSSDRLTHQVIEAGSIAYASESTSNSQLKTVTHTNYGFRPFVVLEFRGFTTAEYELDGGAWFSYALSGRTNTTFTFSRPGIYYSGMFKAFTLYYRLLSIGYGNI